MHPLHVRVFPAGHGSTTHCELLLGLVLDGGPQQGDLLPQQLGEEVVLDAREVGVLELFQRLQGRVVLLLLHLPLQLAVLLQHWRWGDRARQTVYTNDTCKDKRTSAQQESLPETYVIVQLVYT